MYSDAIHALGDQAAAKMDGHAYNLATVGNVGGGAVFVAGLYWIGSSKARAAARAKPAVAVTWKRGEVAASQST